MTITVNIENITVNVNGVRRDNVPVGLLAALFSGADLMKDTDPKPGDTGTASETGLTSGSTEAATGETTAAATAPVQETVASPSLTSDDVLRFLNSDPRYTMRSLDAIAKHFGTTVDMAPAMIPLLDSLESEGKVETKRRRSDGVTLYRALSAPAESPVVVAPIAAGSVTDSISGPALNSDNVLAFLRSDSRYTKRSIDAIAKHFGCSNDDMYLFSMLTDMEDDGDVETFTRRSDGATLYEAA